MKGSLKRLIAIFMLFLHIVSLADGIVPDSTASKNLQLDKAANGVPLVNIEAPDNNGISHNVYKEYNVDGRGTILNNSKDLTNSQLGGLIYGNPNLQNSSEASTIINEVSGVNRSRIEGYQEIAGKKANYILANPNGIYVNGAGFINTGNVTLTTGSRNNLQNPEKGIIEVAGKGLDLRNINKAELVARVAELSAPIYGGEEVNLKLGSQGQSNKPEYVLDAKALGSIYAGRINIVVNEDGVGVKTEAPMYATKGDVVISSKGKVYLKDTQAKGDIKISSTETEISEKLISENKINIENKKLLNKGEIVANNNVSIKGDIENNKLIFTNKDLNIEGNLKNIADIQAKNNIEINSKNIENAGLIVADKKAHINSDNINNTNKLVAKDTLDINNKTLTNSGKILSGKETKIVNQSLNNSGDITSSGKSDLKVRNLTNDGNILSVGNISISQNQKLTNNNQIQSSEDILINSKDIVNNKTMFSKNKLEIKSKSLNNKNEIVAIGKVQIDSDILENDKTNGVIFSKGELNLTSNKINLTTNIGAGKLLKIQTNELERDNSYITNSDLDIKVNGNYKNEYELIGKNLKLEANNLENNSIIASSGNTEIKGNNSFKNNENSLLYGRELLKLEGKDFTNKGEVSSFGNLNMNFTGDITNLNTIEAVGDGEITANNFTNKGYLTGGYSKKWVKGSESNIDINKLPKELIKKVDDELQELLDNTDGENVFWHGNNRHLSDAEEGISHYVAHKAHLKIGENLTFNITNRLLNQEADILAGKNIIINAKELNNTREGKDIDITLKFSRTYSQRGGSWHHHKTEYHDHWVLKPYKQTLYSDKPTQIIAGGNLTINAKEVGNGEYQDHKSGYINDVKKVEKDSNIKNTSIDDTFKITNNSVVEKIKKDSAVGVEDYIEIPKNDNGLFIVNKKAGNPKFSYLIETNPKMIDRGFYLSSEYFFSRIKFNPDKNIRLLGDSFYENRLITRAVLEGTGKRYLYSNNVNEERKKLFDNAIAAQKDLNLSLGVALSKEQINNLKSDILWYVEEVVNGEKVLVPKLYLSKNTLKSIAEEQGNIIKAGGNFVVNNASIVDNSGKIIAKNNVLIKSKNIYQNAAYSDTGIYANDIALTAKENIENIGGNIVAANKVSIYSEDGDIKNSKKLSIHENDYHDVYTDVRGSGNIVANNISIVGNNVENTGADIKAQDKIEIGAKKNLVIGNLEAIDKKVRDGGKDYISDEKRTNIGSNLNAKDISLTSLGDIGITGSNIVATNKASIQAKGDISIVAGKDSVLHEEKHSKSKGFGRSSSEESVAYATRNVASNVIGDKVNITSGKDVNIFGSNVGAKDTGNISAKGTITEAAAKEINYSYHKKTKSGFMGLTGQSSTEKIHQELNAESNLYVKNQGIIGGDIKVIGSNLVLGNNSIINGKLTTDSNELHNSYSYEESKKGFSGSIGSGGFSVGYGKTESGLKEKDIINAKSNLVLGDNVTLNKGAEITATNLTHGKITVNNGDIKFGARKDTKDVETYSKSSGVNLSVKIKSQALDRVQQGFDSFKQMKSGDILGGIASTTNTVTGLVQGLSSNITKKDGSKATLKDIKDGDFKVNNNFYANIGVNLGFNKSSSKSNSHSERAVVTAIKGKDENSSITYNNVKNVEYVGTQAQDTKFIYNNVENINKTAVELKNSYSSTGKSSGISTGVTINYNNGFQTEGNGVSVSASKSKMNSNGTTYQNGRFVNVDEVHNNTKNMTLSGFNQEGGTVTGNIENLIIESKQNTSTTKGSTKGGSLSIAPNGIPSGSANYSQTNGKRRVVDNASTFIIGDGSDLKVAKVENTASAIGTSENGKLSIDEYVGHNLENVDKLKTAGGSVGVSTSGVNNIGVNYSDKKQEGITKNTVIGNVEIGKSSGDEINRDLDTMTEITEDRDFKTNVNIESQTIKYALNPSQFKEDLQIAIIEGKATGRTVVKTIDNVINGDKSQDIGDAERRSLIEIKEAIVRVQTAPAMDIIAEGKLERKEVQEELGVVIEKFDPNDPTLSEKVRERIDELKAEGKEIVAFYDKVTKKIFINQNAKDEEVRASIAREYKIKEDLELGRGKVNDKGQLRSTVAGEIAYDEIKDRLKKGDKNPISASSFDVAKMDKDSEVTSDLRDKNVQREFFNSLPYIATTSNGARKINPKVLKEMQGDKGELEDFIFRADFYIKSIDLLYAESEEGKKKIAIVNPIVDSLNKNSPDREYYKIIDGRKKEVLIASNPKPKSYLHHLLKSLDEFGNAPLHFLEAGDKFLSSNIKGAVREGFAAVNSLFKPATLGFGSKLGDEVGRVRKGSDQYGSKEEVEWKQKSIRGSVESATDIVVTPIVMKSVGIGISKGKEIYKNYKYNSYRSNGLFLPNEYYDGKKLPSQVMPGIKYLPKYDETGNIKQIKMYDDYGRQIGWVDYTNHGYSSNHTIPHWHEVIYDEQYIKGIIIDHRTNINTPLGNK
ncbi:hemagglutinin repeat-containing protein [Fusobacterium nucleatum]|uniref:two-partner secretion domain-containing protein n=2 Tax=Fusobacterium nucleatum TaxID=851 RepID=UPI0030CBD5D8